MGIGKACGNVHFHGSQTEIFGMFTRWRIEWLFQKLHFLWVANYISATISTGPASGLSLSGKAANSVLRS